jgi:hypothetical protein
MMSSGVPLRSLYSRGPPTPIRRWVINALASSLFNVLLTDHHLCLRAGSTRGEGKIPPEHVAAFLKHSVTA